MATTENTYTGNGSLTTYSFTFPYLEESHVKVSLDGVDQLTTTYSFANATTINFNVAPGNGVAIRIYRETDQEEPPSTFFAGSAIRAQDLNDNFLQQLYVAQETAAIAVNLTAGDIAPGSISNTLLADNSVTSAKISDGNVTTAKINTNAVTTVKIADSNITTAKIADSNVTTAKIADSNVTTAKIADSNVTTAKIADSSVTSAKIANDTIVNDDVNTAAAIAGTKISPNFGTQNITTTGSLTANSLTASSLSYPTSDGAAGEVLKTNGSGTLSFQNGVTSAVEELSTQTSVEFTNIPTSATVIIIGFIGATVSATADTNINLGNGGTYYTTGYQSTSTNQVGTGTASSTTNFIIDNISNTQYLSGQMVITCGRRRTGSVTGLWSQQHQLANSNSATRSGGGSFVNATTNSDIDCLRVSLSAGNFTGGAITISYH